MALIKCPECGREVSDKATSCPTCGCPIHEISTSRNVRIKLGFNTNIRSNRNLKAEIRKDSENGELLWNGYVGDVAEIDFDGPTNIFIRYTTSIEDFVGTRGINCSGTIDPSKSKRYNVSTRETLFKRILYITAVDVIDSD